MKSEQSLCVCNKPKVILNIVRVYFHICCVKIQSVESMKSLKCKIFFKK